VGFTFDAHEFGGAELAMAYLRGRGYFRVQPANVKMRRLDLGDGEALLSKGPVLVIQDRVKASTKNRSRLIEAIEYAMAHGGHQCVIVAKNQHHTFTNLLHCSACNLNYPSAVPALFSFNTPAGACTECNGFGRVVDIDVDLCVPDRRVSLEKGAIVPWNTKRTRRHYRKMRNYCESASIPLAIPFSELSAEQVEKVINGDPEHRWRGLRGWFERLKRKAYRMHVRVFLARYRGYFPCPECEGRRYRSEALRWRLGGHNLAQFCQLPLDDALLHLHQLSLPEDLETAVSMVLDEVVNRLTYLVDVGLGYLTLDRQSRTLSGGEVQRVNLTTALGSELVGTLYVLDEPSVGLHPRDNDRLIQILRRIRDLGNTLLVVEHDEAIIRGADHIIDLGPKAGTQGGYIVYDGPSAKLLSSKESLTAQYLLRKTPELSAKAPRATHELSILGARANNLKNIDVHIPVGLLTCITGVSGSGKSTLVVDTLYRGLKRLRGEPTETPGAHEAIVGHEIFEQIVLVDASAVSSSPRSNSATYLKVWDPIRKIFAREEAALQRGYGPSIFSFNTRGGRCEVCEGSGFERVEMQFLSDVYLTCDACNGSRFKHEVLEVTHRGKNIADILEMTADEAAGFFDDVLPVKRRLVPLQRVGLGYLRLGQALSTLSGGEAQRLKLASGLQKMRKSRSGSLYILDEPTTGLHLKDVEVLCDNLEELTRAGHTVLVIEHHLDVIRNADYIIDLGPEGGNEGGEVIATGNPSQIAKCPDSHTGAWLKQAPKAPTPVPPPENVATEIRIKGAREHNLKNVDLTLPRGRMTVITGPSGSGKSSLAFDVLFAEGQRRFIDCLSPYARQYLPQAHRPDLDELSGIPPTIAIEQRSTRTGRRSTVATITEIYHFLRLLFARVGRQHCHVCGQQVQGLSLSQLQLQIQRAHDGHQITLMAPVVKRRKGWHKEVLARATKQGHAFVRVDGDLVDPSSSLELGRYQEHNIDYVTLKDHRVAAKKDDAAFTEALAKALDDGNGTCYVLDSESGEESTYSLELYCTNCSIGFSPPEPRLFSFHGKGSGACRYCEGQGVLDDEGWVPCGNCCGSRLGPLARSVLIQEKSIDQLTALTPKRLAAWVEQLTLEERDSIVAAPITRELEQRCRFLDDVGLDYLTLDRAGNTLSGGESQRVRLASQLASELSGVLYVLDEPTIGLHPSDNERLLEALNRLRARGNTVVVVEHDRATMEQADLIVDMGPGGGHRGGEVIAQGSFRSICENSDSVTGKWLASPAPPVRVERAVPTEFIELNGASLHNLQDLNVRFPAGRFTVVTGVSGSGKTTLVRKVLEPRLKQVIKQAKCLQISENTQIKRVVEVDQSPIGRTPRSTPTTYVGIMSDIRKLFATLPDAKIRGYTASRFSFNVKGGRCDTCAGQGAINLEMAFLPNTFVPCETCDGHRYNSETLRITYRGHSIADVLEATVDEALELFEAQPRIRKTLALMNDLGLGYLTLGQASNTLSGGEAQRIKLVSELRKRSLGDTLYLLDEPSTGLHMVDLERLLKVLQRFVDRGDTLIVIEHNLDVVAAADWIVDLGPGGGENGGQLVYEGAVSELISNKKSPGITASYLRAHVDYINATTCG
jgi:excinuclease ABC subunit A